MQVIARMGENKSTTQWIPNPQLYPYADLWSKLKCTLKDLVMDSGYFSTTGKMNL